MKVIKNFINYINESSDSDKKLIDKIFISDKFYNKIHLIKYIDYFYDYISDYIIKYSNCNYNNKSFQHQSCRALPIFLTCLTLCSCGQS